MPECALASSIARRVSLVNLQKFTFQAWRRPAQHEDVRAGAEDPLLETGHDDRADLGMLEPNALNRVRELDVHAEVVGVQLEPVVGREAAVLLHVHAERGDGPVERQLPVPVATRMGFEARRRSGCGRRSHG